MEVLRRARQYGGRLAVNSTTYEQLLERSGTLSRYLQRSVHQPPSASVALALRPNDAMVTALWGVWRARATAVPLCRSHPPPELLHVLSDARVQLLLAHEDELDRWSAIAASAGLPCVSVEQALREHDGEHCENEQEELKGQVDAAALIVYTSGTTSAPKGVVVTHEALWAQISSLVEAWQYSQDDHLLHALPLHHVHGLVNALLCVLAAGGRVTFVEPKFEAKRVWRAFMDDPTLTLWMAVPTMYHQLIERYLKVNICDLNDESGG
jgi:malonyl-CoA/methylmalonyl-CoA synthetase